MKKRCRTSSGEQPGSSATGARSGTEGTGGTGGRGLSSGLTCVWTVDGDAAGEKMLLSLRFDAALGGLRCVSCRILEDTGVWQPSGGENAWVSGTARVSSDL